MSNLDAELCGYLEWLNQHHGENVAFVVLYGSRARGDAKRHSDYDLLIGLRSESSTSFLDRLFEFSQFEYPRVEAKPFTPSEIEDLWMHYARTLLDAMYEGVVLLDSENWSVLRKRYDDAVQNGILERRGTMWVWHRELEPVGSRRLAMDRL